MDRRLDAVADNSDDDVPDVRVSRTELDQSGGVRSSSDDDDRSQVSALDSRPRQRAPHHRTPDAEQEERDHCASDDSLHPEPEMHGAVDQQHRAGEQDNCSGRSRQFHGPNDADPPQMEALQMHRPDADSDRQHSNGGSHADMRRGRRHSRRQHPPDADRQPVAGHHDRLQVIPSTCPSAHVRTEAQPIRSDTRIRRRAPWALRRCADLSGGRRLRAGTRSALSGLEPGVR